MAIQKSTGSSQTECTLVNKAKGTSTCANVTGTMTDISNTLRAYSVTPYQNTGVPSFDHIRYVTTRAGGLNVRVAWSSGSVGHIAPVIGSTASQDVYITYIRQTAVSGQWVTYSQFKAGTAGLGSSYTPTHVGHVVLTGGSS